MAGCQAIVEISRRVGYRLRTVRSVVRPVGVVARVALVAGLAGLAAPAALAAPAVRAVLTNEFQAGVDAYRLGKYDEARAHLAKAQVMDPKLPGPHRFLAAVARAQRRWSDCIAETRRALQLNPHSQELAETRKLHDDCRAADGRPAYGSELAEGAAIAVTANVAGATVRIGGLRYGGTPVEPRLIKPGALELDIDKQGYKPMHLTVDVLPGIVTDVAIELEAADAKPARPPTKLPPAKPFSAKPPRA